MKRPSIATATLACALALGLAFPAQAKKDKPADTDKPQEENAESGGIPRYQPFPHGQNFILMELNGKAPPREIWLRIDFDGSRHGLFWLQELVGHFRHRAGSSRAPRNARLHGADLRSRRLGVRARILEYSVERPPLGHQGRRSDPQGAQGRRNVAVFALAVRSALIRRRGASRRSTFSRLVQFAGLRKFRDALMSSGLARISFVMFFASAVAGCNSAPSPQPMAPQGPGSRSVTPAELKLPEGSGCSGSIARYRAIMDNDLAMGHVNSGRLQPDPKGDRRGGERLLGGTGGAGAHAGSREQGASRISKLTPRPRGL